MRWSIAVFAICVICLARTGSAAMVASMWDGTVGNWTDVSHWANTPAVSAYPNNVGDTIYSVTVWKGSNGAGYVTLDAPIVVQDLFINVGDIRGIYDLTVNGDLHFSYGQMSGAGTTTVKGTLTLDGYPDKYLDANRVLRNEGVATWSEGNILLNGSFSGFMPGSGAIVNAAGAVFDARLSRGDIGYAGIVGDTNDAHFDNAGTFRRSNGSDLVSISMPFNNTGTVDVQTGFLYLGQSSTHVGAHITGNGSFGVLAGGTSLSHTFDSATLIDVKNMSFNGATSTVNATYNVAGTTSLGTKGIVDFLGPVMSFGATLTISGATANLGSSNQTVTTLTISNGVLTSTGNLTATGTTTFSRGTISGAGSTFAAGVLTLNGANAKVIDGGRGLINQGTATWSAGQIDLNGSTATGSGSVTNSASALFNNTFNGTILATNVSGSDSGTDAIFHNAGIFRKSAGVGTTTISTVFDNTGTTEVLSGTLALTGSTPQHIGASLSGGTWRSVSTSSPTSLTFTGSAIQAIGAAATVEFSGAGASFLSNGVALENSLNSNAGTLRLFHGRTFVPLAAVFTNMGTIELGGTGLAAAGFTAVALDNSGTIRGQGQLTGQVLNTGRIESAFGAPLLAINGKLGGAGILKDVQINGVHAPGADIATVNLEGTYALSNSAHLAIDIGSSAAGTQHDELDSSGNVSLGGVLDVTALNLGGGIFTPSIGDRFSIITATGPITGSFVNSSVTTIASATAITWNVLYGANQVELEVTQVKPLIPGDYNGDDAVDAADYVRWRRLLNTNVLAADGNRDGQINSDDYAAWRTNFGQSASSGSASSALAAVPEPGIFMLLIAGMLNMCSPVRRPTTT